MGSFFYNAGKFFGESSRKANWVIQSLTGSEAEAIEAEHAVGQDLARSYLKQTPADPNPDIQRFLDRIGTRLTECVANPNRKFQFRCVVSDELNAFACPGGFIFLMRPLLEVCEWQADEVAFVMGHEMGHVLSAHSMNRLMASSVIRGALCRVPLGGLFGFGLLNVAMDLLTQGYSRDQELEADTMGVQLVHYAGFDPEGARRLLLRLAAIPVEKWPGSTYFSSHPEPAKRIENVERYLRGVKG